jgi:hypothetical protein
LLQLTPEGSPVRIHTNKAKSGGEPTGEGGESPTDTTGTLLEAGQTMDVVEPLRRIEKALEIICTEAGITQTTAAR